MRMVALVFVAALLGQPRGPYTGDWTADYQGTIYVRLSLSEKSGSPQGAMSVGKSIHVDDKGIVDRADEAPLTLRPLADVRRSGDVWSFSYADADRDVSKFELRLIDANSAELALILSEEERQQFAADKIPLLKPFRLKKSR